MPRKSQAGSTRPAPDKSEFGELLEQSKKFKQVSTDFLKVDLETALTFTGIALQADNDAKKKRNQQSARKAYDTILKLLRNVEPEEGDAQVLRSNLERLKSELQRLGEVF